MEMEVTAIREPEVELTELLHRHLSPPITKALLRRAKERLGLQSLHSGVPPELLQALEKATKPFLPTEAHQALTGALAGLSAAPNLQRIPVQREDDILVARNTARQLALRYGGNNFSAQRASTAVSELARNIVNYTPGGSIALGLVPGSKRLFILSQDSGAGIAALEEILSGRYKSRTGMGLGLLGVKRLSARFEVRSTASGTTIEAEIEL